MTTSDSMSQDGAVLCSDAPHDSSLWGAAAVITSSTVYSSLYNSSATAGSWSCLVSSGESIQREVPTVVHQTRLAGSQTTDVFRTLAATQRLL